MNSITSFFSSFVVHADAVPASEDVEKVEETPAVEEAEEEEEEPEDVHPALREECQNSPKCAELTKHFTHCQEKVSSGEGFKGEDCVEEIMMHCADECAAPKLFAKLK